jgi:hypothetical protein
MTAIDEVIHVPPARDDDPSSPQVWPVQGGWRWRLGYDGGTYAHPTHGFELTRTRALRAIARARKATDALRAAEETT